jgi:hypothetical protein
MLLHLRLMLLHLHKLLRLLQLLILHKHLLLLQLRQSDHKPLG